MKNFQPIRKGDFYVGKTTLPGADFLGLFAARAFKKGEHLIYYTGKLIRDKNHVTGEYSFQHPFIDDGTIEPSMELMEDISKYANHQFGFVATVETFEGKQYVNRVNNPKLNAVVEHEEGDELLAIALRAYRDIREYEEIFYDYGTDYAYTEAMFSVAQMHWALHGQAILQI
jgi:SET domain-containing protein